MSQIDMYFKFPSGREYRIPVIPSEISVRDGANWHRVEVLGLGEVALPAFRKAQEISFSSFFPYQYDAGYCQYPELIHPADAANQFRNVLGTPGVRPIVVRFTIIEEYEEGVWTTWIDDDFSIDEFVQQFKAQELTDLHYTMTLHSARIPTLRSTGALADNIGTQKPYPMVGRTGSVKKAKVVPTGATPASVSRPRISPTNLQLQQGITIEDVNPHLTGLKSTIDPTSPVGGSHYSYINPDGGEFGVDSSPEVTMSEGTDNNALGNYIDPGTIESVQLLRDEYVNNGAVVIDS